MRWISGEATIDSIVNMNEEEKAGVLFINDPDMKRCQKAKCARNGRSVKIEKDTEMMKRNLDEAHEAKIKGYIVDSGRNF